MSSEEEDRRGRPGGGSVSTGIRGPDEKGVEVVAEPKVDERQGTHWAGCGMDGGPRHYGCLKMEYERLRELMSRIKIPIDMPVEEALKQDQIAFFKGLMAGWPGMAREEDRKMMESILERLSK